MNILWLASWYPSKAEPLLGDFFQRHAIAAAQHFNIYVIHVKRNDEIKSNLDITINTENNLTEKVILYKPFLHQVKFLSSITSQITFNKIYKKEVKAYLKQNGKPNFIHVKAAWKSGLIALWAKKKFGIKYLVSEQYTGYFKEAKGLLPTFNFWQNHLLKKVFTNAHKITPVSNYLGKSLQQLYGIQYEVLENVINTNIFKQTATKTKNEKFTLLHVSLLNKQKNPDVLFKAIEILVGQKFDFILKLVAPKSSADFYLNKYSGIKNHVEFIEETNQTQLAKYMMQADVFLFPSLFESFGLVGYESIAAGTPVIVSDIEIFAKHLIDKPYVHTFKVEDASDLVNTIIKFKNDNTKFDTLEMHEFIDTNFSYEKIGERFLELYK